MGKDKNHQRTKGNAKPSSSGRSAELLGGVTTFVGFSGLSDLGYVPAATQATFEDDAQISAEFRIALRKMSKKDSTTKVKALQEFENLCASEESDTLKSALPYWPRLYSKLTFDCNRLVREGVQNAHNSLVSQMGKNLAPYLRSVMPSWLLAMTDPHVPAAITASKSFQTAFSDEKRPGVMIFCSKEIIDAISDNLFIHSAQTLSDPKNTVKEDQDSKYIRVLFSSLKGLALFLEITAKLSDKKGEISAKLVSFLDEEKFWTLAKHENTLIRSAWFDTITALFEFDVELLKNYTDRLVKSVFASLDSPDAIVLPHIWITFLHLCVGLPECWDQCGNPKSVFNRLFSVLRDGGRGVMTKLSPQLLPILSVIPARAMESQTDFYIDFFRAISTSLRKEKVLACKRELSAIIVALNECLKYISKEHGTNKQLWDTLMKYQVVDLLKSSFVDTPQLSETQLYQEVGKLLLYWSNVSDGKTVNSDKFSSFWELFLPECQSWVAEGDRETISKLKTFFTILKDPFSTFAKRSRGVRFTDDRDSTAGATLPQENRPFSTSRKENYGSDLEQHLSPLIEKSFKVFLNTRKDSVFDLFAALLFLYSSERTYHGLVGGKVDDHGRAQMLFLEEHILPLMEEGDWKSPLGITVDVFIHVYGQLPQQQQQNLLMNLKPTLRVDSLKALVEKMTEVSERDGVAALWLKSPPLGGRLVKCLQQLCAITLIKDSLQSSTIKEQHHTLVELMAFVFSNGHKKHVVFSLEYLNQMLSSLKSTLLQVESQVESLDQECTTKFILMLIRFLNCLLESSIHSLVDGLQDIMKIFFRLLCHPLPTSTDRLQTELKDCFLKALELSVLDKTVEYAAADPAEALLEDENTLLAYVLKEMKLLVMSESRSFAQVLELGELIDSVMGILFSSFPFDEDFKILLDHFIMQPVLQRLLPTEYEWSQLEDKLSPIYTTPAILHGSFICREFCLPRCIKDTPSWHQGFVKASLFLVRLLISLCRSAASLRGESPEQDLDEGSVSLGQFIPLVVLALHGTCHATAMLQMNTSLNNNSVTADIKMGSQKLADGMRKLLEISNEGNKKLIVKILRDRCSHGNNSWCVTLGHVLTTWITVPINVTKLIEELDDNFLGCTETKQILLPFLPKESIFELLMEETENLSQYSEDVFSALPSVCLVSSALERLSSTRQQTAIGAVDPERMETAIHTIFTVLVEWRDATSNIFLFASDLSDVPWEEVSLLVSIIRLLTVVVKGHSQYLLHSHWDVTLCALSAWVQSLVEVAQFPECNTNTVVAMFATACSKCAGVVAEVIVKLKRDPTLKESYPATLVEEWQEFFAPSIFNTLLLKFIQCANLYEEERSVILYSLSRSLAVSVNCMEEAAIREITLPPLFDVKDSESTFKLPDKLQSLLNHLGPLMLSRHPQCQTASYSLLKVALPEVMAAWEENKAGTDEDEEDVPQRPLPRALMSIIEESGSIVETALIDKEMGCTCEILPNTDAYTFTAGYLLGWFLVLTAITHGEERNQQLYASYIRESNLLWSLLNNLFKLMPLQPNLDKKQTAKDDATMFNTPIPISASESVSSQFIAWLSCQVYMACLDRLPAAVRNWWTHLDRITQQTVDKFTTAHVSPILIANEINTMNGTNVKFDNMTIKTRLGAREVIAVYTIDEASMELVLRMAPNHPLSTVNLEDHKRVGVSLAMWRNWLFGLNTMLSHRNTPLLNSLEFWKKNVDQMFEGIEECFICYYVLHGTNHQIPKLLCRTCKKKYHSACLYKWFSTSNNSSCPICRSLF